MRTLSVLWFIVTASARNRVVRQIQRLRQPKYLVATLAGLAYFWFFFGRRWMGTSSFGHMPDEFRPLIVAGLTALATALLLLGWIVGKTRAELVFSEAEIQLLFPGPTSRRSLLLYKIGRNLSLVLLSTLLMTLIFGARISSNPLFFVVGAWLALSTYSLHETASTLTRAAALLKGARGVVLLAVGIGAVVVALLALGYVSFQQVNVPDVKTGKLPAVGVYFEQVFRTPVGLLLYPIRAPIQAALAPDWRSFLSSLPAAVVLLLVHVAWVLRSDVAFEEGSVALAEKRARLLEQRRGRRGAVQVEAPKGSLKLGAAGRPEWALVWKNVIATRRLMGGKMLRLAIPFLVLGVMMVATNKSAADRWAGAVIAALALVGFLVLMGPTWLRTDFRMDHANMDILRTLPLSGFQIVAGQMVGPVLLLAFAQWAAIAVALVASVPVHLEAFPFGLRVSVAVSAAFLAPALTACGFVVQNAAVLLLPTWTNPGLEQARGFEGMGQRLLTLAGSLVVLLAGVLPAVAIGGAVLFLVWVTVGPIGAPIAAAVAAAVLLGEVMVALWGLGGVFERYDVTAE